MSLADYLKKNELSAAAMARLVGVPTSTITRLINGQIAAPTITLVRKIEDATKGAVTGDDLFPRVTAAE